MNFFLILLLQLIIVFNDHGSISPYFSCFSKSCSKLAPLVRNGVFSYKMDYITIFLGYQNRITG